MAPNITTTNPAPAETYTSRTFTVNPFGPLYNPASIVRIIRMALENENVTADELFFHNGLYRSFACHTLMCRPTAEDTLRNINRSIHLLNKSLLTGKLTIITLGTAKVYEQRSTGHIVANCHKLPASEFNTHMLSVSESEKSLAAIISDIKAFNPDMKFIFTVSPVRHISDGAHVNSLSKATLLLAVNDICSRYSDCAYYFPAYELVIDDLRDYRFFASDMCHPSDLAVDYVFERFAETYIPDQSLELASKCLKITRRMNHRQLTADNESYRQFREATVAMLDELTRKYTFLKPQADRLINLTE